MTEQALVRRSGTEVVAWEPNDEMKNLVRATVFPGSTDPEMLLFMHECQRRGVHPLDRLIYPQVYTDQRTGARRLTFVTAIDQMRAVAGDTGAHAGTDEPAYGPVREFRIESKPVEAPEWASVTVHKVVSGQIVHFTHKVWWVEYAPDYLNKAKMWMKMPHNQLAKCAEAGALRKGFPRELNKTFEREEPEIIQAEDDEYVPTVKEVVAALPPAPAAAPEKTKAVAAKPAPTPAPTPAHDETAADAAAEEFDWKARFEELARLNFYKTSASRIRLINAIRSNEKLGPLTQKEMEALPQSEYQRFCASCAKRRWKGTRPEDAQAVETPNPGRSCAAVVADEAPGVEEAPEPKAATAPEPEPGAEPAVAAMEALFRAGRRAHGITGVEAIKEAPPKSGKFWLVFKEALPDDKVVRKVCEDGLPCFSRPNEPSLTEKALVDALRAATNALDAAADERDRTR